VKSRDNVRQVYPIILTDRTVAGNEVQREWALTDTLHAIYRPVGYRGIVRPVYVVVSKLEHLWAVESTAIARATIANVDAKDMDGSIGEHRAVQARKAKCRIYEAISEVDLEHERKNIDFDLSLRLTTLLEKAGATPEPFTKRWEIALPLYAGIAAVGVPNCYTQIFGSDDRSPDSIRQDQARGRKFIQNLLARVDLDCADAPHSKIGVEIADKYLNALLPVMAPHFYETKKIELNEVCSVTRRGGAVTKMREKSLHGTTKRSFDSTPLAQVFARFPDGARS
jgi:hypothetical protein